MDGWSNESGLVLLKSKLELIYFKYMNILPVILVEGGSQLPLVLATETRDKSWPKAPAKR